MPIFNYAGTRLISFKYHDYSDNNHTVYIYLYSKKFVTFLLSVFYLANIYPANCQIFVPKPNLDKLDKVEIVQREAKCICEIELYSNKTKEEYSYIDSGIVPALLIDLMNRDKNVYKNYINKNGFKFQIDALNRSGLSSLFGLPQNTFFNVWVDNKKIASIYDKDTLPYTTEPDCKSRLSVDSISVKSNIKFNYLTVKYSYNINNNKIYKNVESNLTRLGNKYKDEEVFNILSNAFLGTLVIFSYEIGR